MVNTKKPGLPESFNLKVKNPVELGDYFDLEEGGGEAIQQSTAYNSQPTNQRSIIEEPPSTKPRDKEPPRKQINMKPETLRKVDELLKIIRETGPQKDAAASELFDAMVSAVFDAKDDLNFSHLAKRGRWGSATAEAFVAGISYGINVAISTRSYSSTSEITHQDVRPIESKPDDYSYPAL